MRIELDHLVAHPPERVFAFMADPANRPRWQGDTRAVEPLSDGPPGVGTRWRARSDRLGSYELGYTEFEPGRGWVEQGVVHGIPGRIRVALSPEGESSTRLRIRVEMALRGTRRLLEPAIGPMVRRQMTQDIERVERLLD
jgi:uncharacterized protein YndB with AHSA1/START domain